MPGLRERLEEEAMRRKIDLRLVAMYIRDARKYGGEHLLKLLAVARVLGYRRLERWVALRMGE